LRPVCKGASQRTILGRSWLIFLASLKSGDTSISAALLSFENILLVTFLMVLFLHTESENPANSYTYCLSFSTSVFNLLLTFVVSFSIASKSVSICKLLLASFCFADYVLILLTTRKRSDLASLSLEYYDLTSFLTMTSKSSMTLTWVKR
jgi:hypothetical protein